ncbi:MFS transporter [Leekyejoonella antrihumi]|uniref:DHA2 family efflux MFS transporter permease subunit n=1 Tax=Leekyejoonella antrihumi TaxID=1660198 RepID=A0A563E7U2_9MICO|nr:MFS transporter [Leekyejoonella antrihumi]TWP38271.1 DHA2 family efflux MFS transporter permease subunit [Leekyejoonella antrihumi]
MSTSSSSSVTVPVQRAARPHTTIILAVVLMAQLMLVLDMAIVNIALPDIKEGLHMSPSGLSWVVNAYTLAFGGLLLLGARAGDVLGRRWVFITGLAMFTLASLAGGLAQTATLLLAARAAQGVGAALAAPSALALLMGSVRPGREQTRAIGWYTVVSAGGAAVGLIAGGVLTSIASWRWIFFVNVPIGAVILVLAVWTLPAMTRHRSRIDVTGAVLATVGMSSLVYGFIRAASDGWTDLGTTGAFGIGVLLLVAFVAVELRIGNPVVPLHLFADRQRSTAYLARLLLVAGAMGTFFFMSQFMQLVLGWTPWQSGLAFLPIPVSIFAASQIVARFLAHRASIRSIAAVGLLAASAGLFWMSTLSATSTYGQLLPALVLFGLGNGAAFIPLTSAGVANVAPEDSGVASGLVNVTQQLGGSLGLAVLVTIFATAGHGSAAVTGASSRAIEIFVTGADRGFLAAGLLASAALLLVLLLMPATDPNPTRASRPAVTDEDPVAAGR